MSWEYAQLTHGVTIATDHQLLWSDTSSGESRMRFDDVVEALNEVGQVGWELVAVDTKHHLPDLEGNRWTNTIYTFKREAGTEPFDVLP